MPSPRSESDFRKRQRNISPAHSHRVNNPARRVESDSPEPKKRKRVVAGSAVVIGLSAAVGVSGVAWSTMGIDGISTWNTIISEPVIDSPYVQVSEVKSRGKEWGEQIIKKKPSSLSDKTSWNVIDSSRPVHALDPKTCAEISNVPSSVIAAFTGNSDVVTVVAQVYGAGQATDNFYDYKKKLSNCMGKENVKDFKTDNGSAFVYDSGFMITMGDTIIGGFDIKDEKVRDKTLEFYAKEMASSLRSSQCRDISAVQGNNVRSPFYGEELYKGLIENQTMKTRIPVEDIPEPTSYDLNSILMPDMQQPEAPIPSDYPKIPSKTVDKPELPKRGEARKAEFFDEVASYNIPDEIGPGCGWEWSGQKSLVYDKKSMKSTEEREKRQVQSDVDSAAKQYVHDQTEWATKIAALSPSIDSWNNYSTKVNKVHDRWNYLETEREKIKPDWESFVKSYEDWYTFDDRQKWASAAYDNELQQCIDKQEAVTEWEQEWGEKYAEVYAIRESATKTREVEDENGDTTIEEYFDESILSKEDKKKLDQNIPNRPEDCTELPEKPEILTQSRPSEPKPPSMPNDVTIPDSWDSVAKVIARHE